MMAVWVGTIIFWVIPITYIEFCKQNCEFLGEAGCATCKDGYKGEPKCCECADGYVMNDEEKCSE